MREGFATAMTPSGMSPEEQAEFERAMQAHQERVEQELGGR